MGVLLEQPNVKHFESLPHICKAVKRFNLIDAERLIKELGSIFVKHNVTDTFGLALVHRHFDMTSEELLVETCNATASLSVAFPWRIHGGIAEPLDVSLMEEHSLNPGKWIVPQSWSFCEESGSLVAYEYISHPVELSPPPEDFARELHEALKCRGIESLIGIRRLVHLYEKNSWEVTPEGVRANITRIGIPPPEYSRGNDRVNVIWGFNSAGEFRRVGDCGSCHTCYICIGKR